MSKLRIETVYIEDLPKHRFFLKAANFYLFQWGHDRKLYMEAKKEMVKQNCKSQPNAEEEASILESVQDLNFTFSIKTKIQLWPLLKIHPNFFHIKIISSSKITKFWLSRLFSNFKNRFNFSKYDFHFWNRRITLISIYIFFQIWFSKTVSDFCWLCWWFWWN